MGELAQVKMHLSKRLQNEVLAYAIEDRSQRDVQLIILYY